MVRSLNILFERQIAERPEKTMMIVRRERDWQLMAINVRAGMQVNLC
jgi:hypothetical protein